MVWAEPRLGIDETSPEETEMRLIGEAVWAAPFAGCWSGSLQ